MLRIGQGYDVHKLVEGRDLILGGVKVPFYKGLLGHSDADVLTHAIMDALLGAIASGDIGMHFPDNEDKYKDANSIMLLKEVKKILDDNKVVINNIDATIICEKPKLRNHIDDMRKNISNALKIQISQVSVKATTEEGLGFTGEEKGIASLAMALVEVG